MKVWLIQRSEPTPHDNNGKQRAMRMGIIAQMLVQRGHKALWWTSTFDHYNRCHRYNTDKRVLVESTYGIQYLHGCGYKRNISLSRMRENKMVARRFSNLAAQETEPPDVIMASLPTVELALEAVNYGKKRDIPVFLDIRDLWPDVFFDLVPRAVHPLLHLFSLHLEWQLRKACAGASGILGLTDAFVNWGVERAGRYRSNIDQVFPMGYFGNSLSEKRINAGRNLSIQFGINPQANDLIVVFFGTLGRCFDIIPIIEAAQMLQDSNSNVKFIICGDGENLKELKNKAQKLDNVIFPGWANAEQIQAILNMADLGIAPYIESTNFINNIPNKPAEYLSGGAAIALSLDHGELYDFLIKHECGFSYKNRAEQLAIELDVLSKQADRLKVLQSNALQTFRSVFDGDLVYGKLIDYLEDIVQKNTIAFQEPQLRKEVVSIYEN
jgi:glycosyltransferase involved in cell wall biosynthesis